MECIGSVAAEGTPSSTDGAAAQPLPPAQSQARKKKVIRAAREKGRVAARCEYVLFLACFLLFRLLPFRLAFRLGEGVGGLLYLFDRPHRRVGLLNLTLAF